MFFKKLLHQSQDGPPSLTAGACSRPRPCMHFTQDGALGTPDGRLHPDSYTPWMHFLSTHSGRPVACRSLAELTFWWGRQSVSQVSSNPRQVVEKALRLSEAVGTLTAPLKLAWAAASGQGEGQVLAGFGGGCGDGVWGRPRESAF